MIRIDTYDNQSFDRGAPRWKELLWYLCRDLFFLYCPPLPSSWRVSLLRLFGAKVGEGVVIRERCSIQLPWRLSIGDHCWIGEGVEILCLDEVSIAEHCCISQGAYLCTGSHDFHSESFDLITAPIAIASHSWVGARAFVGAGVSVGEECLVGAGAVLIKDLPAQHRALGNPAQIEPIEIN